MNRLNYRFEDDGSIDNYDHEEDIDEVLINAMEGIWTDVAVPTGLNREHLYRSSRNTTYRGSL